MTPDESNKSTPQIWVGRILSALVIAFLLLDASMKLVPIQPVFEAMQSLGFTLTPVLARTLGGILLACTLLHAIPKTSLLGAILLTGFLGGAIAVNVRAGTPLFSHILFGGYIGILLWAGLLMRNRRLREILFP
jgi:hypothetical protein